MRKIFRVFFIFFSSVASVSALAQTTSSKPGTSVYGGKLVRGSDAPWQAVIYLANKGASSGLLCGATLIAPNWVVTAAHCFYNHAGDRIPTPMLGIAAGTLKLTGQKQVLPFDEPILFDGYTFGDWDKDIALVRLKKSAGGAARPIVLASLDDEKSPPSTFRVAGWGKTETLAISDNLLFAILKPVSMAECAKVYPKGLTNRTLCAGDPPKDACHGDSGGPLYTGTGVTAVQFGVVAAGEGCGKNPGVYSRVSRHRDWIEKTVAKTGDKLPVSSQFKATICTPAAQLKNEC